LDSKAEIHNLIAVALGPHLEDTGRVRFSGPPVSLGSRHAVALSLTIHELGTNAAKYGALSNDAGQVTLTWGASDPGPQATFRLEWRESGGPVVAEPRRRGFGSSIMEHVLGPEFGGTVEVRYAPEGFVLVLTAPAPGIVVGAPQDPGAASPDVAAEQPGTDLR
jgi:two-component sensor histidine kinase